MEKVKGGKEKEEVQEGLVLLWYRIFLQQHRIVFGQERKEEGTEEAKGEENQEKTRNQENGSRSRSKSLQDDEEKRALRAAFERSQLQLKVLRELQGVTRFATEEHVKPPREGGPSR